MSKVKHILHVSDIHFGVEDQVAIDIFNQYTAAIDPDIICVSGDLTQRGARPEFEQGEIWLKSLPAPVLATPGNHDTPLLNLKDRLRKPFERYRDAIGDENDMAEVDGLAIAGLNTSRGWQARANWAEGSFNLNQLDEVLARLASARADAATFSALACHHPLWKPHGARLAVHTKRSERATKMIAHSDVDVVLCGHVHQPSAELLSVEKDRVLQVCAGTLSTRTRGQAPSFNRLTISDESIKIEAVFIENGSSRQQNLGTFSRGGD